YPDPKYDIRGNPIIDLACFSGVARDIMKLPASDEGYDLLFDFATGEVAGMLNLSEESAEKIFNLGRALQCAHGSRFRVESEPTRAKELASASIAFLNQLSG